MSIPLRKMGRALSRFGPLTDVWVVASVVSTTEITVALWQRPGADGAPGAAPNLGASVLADYQGALVRFDTGDLSGITQGVGVNATGAFITTIDTVTTTTSPAVCTVTFKDAMPATPAAGDLLTVIRNLRNGSTVDINGNVQATIDTSGGPVDISGPVTFPEAQDVNLSAQAIDVSTNNTRVGGTIEEIGSGTGITDYNTAFYTFDIEGLGAFSYCLDQSTNETMNLGTLFFWAASTVVSDVVFNPSTSYSSWAIPAGQNGCVSNLLAGAPAVGFVVSWPTKPTSGSYEFAVYEYSS